MTSSNGLDTGHNGGSFAPIEAYEDDRFREQFGPGATEPEEGPDKSRAEKEAERKKKDLLARLVSAAEPDGELARPYVIKGVVLQKAPGLIFGESGAAKTAVFIDMAKAITTGIEYYGRRTDPGFVIMYAVEDGDGIPSRVEAEARRLSVADADLFRQRYRRLKDPGLWLRGKQGDNAVSEVIEVAQLYAEATGLPCRMIQVDTMPKAIAGETMNDDAVITEFIMRAQRIAEVTGAAVIASAHPGHNEKGRQAGSAQGTGSFYLIIRVDIDRANSEKIQNSDKRTIYLKKVKGHRQDYALGQYTLDAVEIGTDDDGDPIEAVVLNRSETIELNENGQSRRGPTGTAARAEETLLMLYEQGRDFTVTGKEIGIHDAPSNELWRVVDEADLRAFCRERLLSDRGAEGTSKEISDRESIAYGRAMSALDTKFRRAGRSGGLAWLVSQNQRRTDTEPKAPPPPKKYRKPGALTDSGEELTQPTPTDIVGSVGFGEAGSGGPQNRQTPTYPLRDVGLSVGPPSDAISKKPGATAKAKPPTKPSRGKQSASANHGGVHLGDSEAPAKTGTKREVS